MKRNAFFGLLIALSLFACGTPDTVAPVIESADINGKTEDVTLAVGGDMLLNMTFSDNEELKEYKVDIHDDFDAHAHKTQSNTRLSYLVVKEISGTTASATEQISLGSETAAGPYHINISVLDDEGNEGVIRIMELLVTNDNQADINVSYPNFSNTVTFSQGSSIPLAGTISDDVDLVEITVEVVEAGDHSHKKAGTLEGTPLFSADFDLSGTADTSWDLSNVGAISIPADAELGHYDLIITASDSDDNLTIFEGEIDIE